MKDLCVSRVDGLAAIRQLGAEIDRLNRTAARPNPFLSAAFLLCYSQQAEYHTPDRDERLYLIKDGERLLGIAPMRRTMQDLTPRIGPLRCRGTLLGLLAPLDTERPGILAAPEDEERVTHALLQHLCEQEHDWGMLEFVGQPPDSALYRSMHAATNGQFRARDISVEPYTEIELTWTDLRAYFRSLTKKMRSNIGRQGRRLFAHGEPQFVLAEGAAAVEAWFDAYCDLDARSWKHGTGASIQRHPRRIGFYKEIIAARAGLSPSFIGVILDGVLVAGLIVGSDLICDRGRRGAWFLEMAYDQTQADLGPGQLLLLLGVGQALERGERFVNFMQNFAYYKHRWGAALIPVVSVQLIRRASLHNVRATLGEVAKRAMERMRRGKGAGGEGTNGQQAASNAAAQDEPAQSEGPQTPQGDTPPGAPLQAVANRDLLRARQLTDQALTYTGPGLKRLDRRAARAYLPFDIE